MKENQDFSKFSYKEFCAYMKRYKREFDKKEESVKKVNKLAYKPVFKKKQNDK